MQTYFPSKATVNIHCLDHLTYHGNLIYRQQAHIFITDFLKNQSHKLSHFLMLLNLKCFMKTFFFHFDQFQSRRPVCFNQDKNKWKTYSN